jgi:tRNA A-37 threonylcarbamoyl transferase component Bud32
MDISIYVNGKKSYVCHLVTQKSNSALRLAVKRHTIARIKAMDEKIVSYNFEETDNFEEIKAEAIDLLAEFETEAHFIDKGGAGAVYALPNNHCLKVLLERHEKPNHEQYDLGNTVAEEARLQEQMARTTYAGPTRVPHTLAYLAGIYPIERNAIVMERLNAVNLQHAINGTAKLPEQFDLDTFFTQLEDFVDHMHTVEKIAHLDLYARNIMVDNETAIPYVIDFGRSERLLNPDTNRAKEQHDWDRLEEVYERIKALQDNQNML